MAALSKLALTQEKHRKGSKMKAIVRSEYGSVDVLRLEDVEKPKVKDNELRVKIHAASVSAGDWHLMRGTPWIIRLIFGGLLKPRGKILGTDMAGQIEVVGKDVMQFKPGDQVFGDLSECGFGTFAEYVSVPAKALALKPHNLSFEESATVPVSGLAALQAIRNYGQMQPGQQVLIQGASGGVGSFAVQIAKAFGAQVTGVCSTQKIDFVRELGADHIIDYTKTDCTQVGPYDLIIDAAAYRSVFDYLPALTPNGNYVLVGGSTARFFQVMFLGPLISKVISQNVKCLASAPNQADLITLKDLIDAGKIFPAIDHCYKLSEIPAAFSRLEQRQVRGKIAISI